MVSATQLRGITTRASQLQSKMLKKEEQIKAQQEAQRIKEELEEQRRFQEEQIKAQQEAQRQAEEESNYKETAFKILTGQIVKPKGFDIRTKEYREIQSYVESNPSLSGLSSQDIKLSKTLGGVNIITSEIPPTKLEPVTEKSTVKGKLDLTKPLATYDVKTQTYISPEGYGQSMSVGNALKSGAVIIKDVSKKIPKIDIQLETKRYENLGYSQTEAKELAKESVSRGGVTYSGESAKKIIDIKKPVIERFYDVLSGRKEIISPASIMEKKIYQGKLTPDESLRKLGNIKEQITTSLEGRNKIIEDINKLLINNINEKNEWIGSEADYKKYETLINELSVKEKKLSSYGITISGTGEVKTPEIELGTFGLTRKYNILDIDTDRVTAPFSIFGKVTGATIGVGIERTGITLPSQRYFGEEIGKVVRGEVPITDYFGFKKQPEVVIDLKTGVYRLATDKDTKKTPLVERLPENLIWRPEEIGKVVSKGVEAGVDIGKYYIPFIGTGLAVYETGRSIKESKNIIDFVKEKPLEAFGTGILLLRGGKYVKGIVKKVEAKRIDIALQNVLGESKTKFITVGKRNKFITFGEQIGDGAKREIIGVGKELKTESGKTIYKGLQGEKITGEIIYKNIFGIPVKRKFVSTSISEVGTKPIGKPIQIGNINALLFKKGGAIKAGAEPVFSKLELFKGRKKIMSISSKGESISLTESLSQPTKLESVTKIRTPESIGFEIKITTKEKGIKFVKPAEIKKTPFEITFGEQIQKKITKQATPKIKISKPIIPSVTSSLVESKYPTYVGGTKITTGFGKAGIGTNVQEETMIELPPKQYPPIIDTTLTPKTILNYKTTEVTKQLPQIKSQYKQELKPTIKIDLGIKPQEKELEKQREQQIQKIKQQQKQQQRQIQKQISLLTPRTYPRVTIPTIPKKIKVPLPKPTILFGEDKTKGKEFGERFEVYIGKKGKEQKIAETLELFKAGRELKRGLKTGLQAGGFVQEKKTGRRIKFGELSEVLGKEFRPSVMEETRIIQKRGFRLGTFGERRQIQQKRKESKPKRLKWL